MFEIEREVDTLSVLCALGLNVDMGSEGAFVYFNISWTWIHCANRFMSG